MSGSSDSYPEIPSGGLPDVDKRSCQLLGPTALIVQALMGALVILSLVYKRHRERPKRPWGIWLFDVSKQVVGQLFVHISNLLVSGITSGHTSGNACVAYFLNILIDTTFGVALIYVSLHAFTRLFTERFRLKGFESGVYGDPPSVKFWIRQAALYLLSLSTMKVVVVTLLTLFPGIYTLGKWLLKWTWLGEEEDFQVVFVMGIFPILMNIIQFWLIDSIVKASTMTAVSLDIEQGSEPLFQGDSDEDDEDDDDCHPSQPNARNRRSSSISRTTNSFDDRSFNHGATAISTKETSKPADCHSYPPSLESSTSSNMTSSHDFQGPRIAKNLMKKTKRRVAASQVHFSQPETSHISGPGSISQTLPHVSVVEENAEWADEWDDDEWAHQKFGPVGGEERGIAHHNAAEWIK